MYLYILYDVDGWKIGLNWVGFPTIDILKDMYIIRCTSHSEKQSYSIKCTITFTSRSRLIITYLSKLLLCSVEGFLLVDMRTVVPNVFGNRNNKFLRKSLAKWIFLAKWAHSQKKLSTALSRNFLDLQPL